MEFVRKEGIVVVSQSSNLSVQMVKLSNIGHKLLKWVVLQNLSFFMKSGNLNVNFNPNQQARQNMNSLNLIKSRDKDSLGKSRAHQ